MFKWRDFYLMKVYNSKNKYITTIEEPALNESGIEAKKKGF